MRTFVTTLCAFLLSLVGGGLVAQALAERTGAKEEYIIVFALTFIVAFVATAMFWVAQLRAEPGRAVTITAKLLLFVYALFLLVLVSWSYTADRKNAAMAYDDRAIIAGLVLPGVAIILIQWLFVGWRVARHPSSGFGRGVT